MFNKVRGKKAKALHSKTFGMSHEKAKFLMTIFNLTRLKKKCDAYTNLCDDEPTIEECQKFLDSLEVQNENQKDKEN